MVRAILNVATVAGTSMSLSGTPLAGDVLVCSTTTVVASPSTPTAVTGWGATWTIKYADARSTVWIGTGATTGGTVAISGGTAASCAVWHLRGVEPIVSTAIKEIATASTAGHIAPQPVNLEQVVLAVLRRGSTITGDAATTPAGGWTGGTGSNRAWAHAVPPTPGNYSAGTISDGTTVSAGAVASVIVQVVVGTPAPTAPTALALVPHETSIDATWAPGSGDGIPTGYTVSLDGAAPVDVGNVTAWTFTPLAPSTPYVVDVRAYNAAGTSPASSASITTLDPPPDPSGPGGYATHLRVGSHAWDVSSSTPPDYGPTADVRFGWTAREDDGWPTQPDPSVLSFGVVVAAGDDFDDVDQGTWVHFTFTPDGYAHPLVEFGGKVRDLVCRPHPLGMVYEIVAVDAMQVLREEYTTAAFIPAGTIPINIWPEFFRDAAGAGMGQGSRPYLPDPLTGQDHPGLNSGTTFADRLYEGSTFDVVRDYAADTVYRDGASPSMQRVILSYQLDAAGDLDPALPYLGTWMKLPVRDVVAGVPTGNLIDADVDACDLRTDATEWSRPRIEPNIVKDATGAVMQFRPHTGVDIVRVLDDPGDPFWITHGVESDSQWSTRLELVPDSNPDVVDGWFDLPTAMSTFVVTDNIDPRHTPDGSGRYAGLLSGATLLIRPGGTWSVEFTLRRTLPEPS